MAGLRDPRELLAGLQFPTPWQVRQSMSPLFQPSPGLVQQLAQPVAQGFGAPEGMKEQLLAQMQAKRAEIDRLVAERQADEKKMLAETQKGVALEGMKQQGATARKRADIEARAEEGKLRRKSAEKIAGMYTSTPREPKPTEPKPETAHYNKLISGVDRRADFSVKLGLRKAIRMNIGGISVTRYEETPAQLNTGQQLVKRHVDAVFDDLARIARTPAFRPRIEDKIRFADHKVEILSKQKEVTKDGNKRTQIDKEITAWSAAAESFRDWRDDVVGAQTGGGVRMEEMNLSAMSTEELLRLLEE